MTPRVRSSYSLKKFDRLAAGQQDVVDDSRDDLSAAFREVLLRDLSALEEMLRADALETGLVRIGAEQDMFLVDQAYRPAPIASQVLEQLRIADSRPR